MSVTLSLSVSESNINVENNTSKVTAKLYANASGASYNGYSQYGYIEIGGTKYTFHHSFAQGKKTLLATKSKTVTHNSDGSKTITVKGYYQTGVSAGNLSKTVTKTLTKINRNNTVILDLQGGSINGATGNVTYTKAYNATLSLPTPIRTGYTFKGWCTGKNGAGTNYNLSYSVNSDVTLYAAWVEQYSILTYEYGHGIASTTINMLYSAEIKADSPPSVAGYQFLGWLNSNTGLIVQSGSVIKTSNSLIDNTTLTAQWSKLEYTVSFNGNGATSGSMSSISADYGDNVNIPNNSFLRTNYTFAGWSTTSSGSVVYPNNSTITNITSNVVLFAVWESENVNISYYNALNENNFSLLSNYSTFSKVVLVKNSSYTLENVGIPDLENYTFSGYYTSSPNERQYTEYGVTLPKGVIPYNYSQSNPDNYLGIGSSVYTGANSSYFAVYKDNTPSTIVETSTSFNYINDSVTKEQYFSYITGKIFDIGIETSSDRVVCVAKLTGSLNNSVRLDISEISASLVNVEDSSEIIGLEPVFYKSVENIDSNSIDFYLIYRNLNTSDLDETASYILTINGIKDSFGKTLNTITIIITPPKIVRDINREGNVISLFGKAPDYNNELHNNELIINGDIIANDLTINDITVENNLLISTEESLPSSVLTNGNIDVVKFLLYLYNR